MDKNWRPLTKDELAGLTEGDPVVIRASSKGGVQWTPSQRLHPEFFHIKEAKY
jgi:hypothetical protein